MKKVTKAIILAAGQGTRFLPQTKAMPKEMLPLIDKPIIQYVVEEAVAAGITDIIMITGAHKRSIEDHFDHQYELERSLDAKGKGETANQLRRIADMANFIYIRQKGETPGTGAAVLNASHLVDDEPYLVLFGDELFKSMTPRAVQLVEAYEKYQAPIIPLVEIPKEQTGSYGVADVGQPAEPGVLRINGIVEKPDPASAPSNFAVTGGYILNREIMDILETQAPDEASGELYLPIAISQLAKHAPVYGKVLEGTWHDTGNKKKYLQAIADYAMDDPELGPEFADFVAAKMRRG